MKNLMQAATGGVEINCKNAPKVGDFKAPDANAPAIDHHWAQICPTWGGQPDATGTCRLPKTVNEEELHRLQGCALTKLVKDDLTKMNEQVLAGNEMVNAQLVAA